MSTPAEVPSGTTVWIPNQAVEETIRMVLTMWGTEQPNEVRAFKQHMNKTRSQQLNDNGMSAGGKLRSVLEMPPRLHKCFIKVTGDPEYLQDKKFMKALWSECPGFFTSKSTTGGPGV